MDKSEEYSSLVAFTALAPVAVGALVGLLVLNGPPPREGIDWAAVTVLAAGILSLLLSLLHLGRPWRAPLALINPATSWLSREVILFGLFLILLAAYAFMPLVTQSDLGRFFVGLLAAIVGLAGTIASGEIYRLHARPSWDYWLSVTSFPLGALSAGLLFGFFVGHQVGGHPANAPLAWAVAGLFLVVSLAVTLLRSLRRPQGSPEAQRSRQLAMDTYPLLIVVRGIGVIAALGLISLGGEAMYFAWIPAVLGELADRFLFFKTVVPVTLRGRYI